MELLDLRGAKWLWSGFGCQIHSTPIQKDHCFDLQFDLCPKHLNIQNGLSQLGSGLFVGLAAYVKALSASVSR